MNAVTKRMTELQRLNSQKIETEGNSIKKEGSHKLRLTTTTGTEGKLTIHCNSFLVTDAANRKKEIQDSNIHIPLNFVVGVHDNDKFLPIWLVLSEHLKKVRSTISSK